MADETWSFGIDVLGDLHVMPDAELPEGENLIHVRVRRDGDMWRIAAADLPALRQLIGTETRQVLVPRGLDSADELDDMLTKITLAMQSRIDALRGDGDGDEDEPPAPGMGR